MSSDDPRFERASVLLCDADGNLFPSEEPAFDASAEVTNRFLARIGSSRRVTSSGLRLATTGKNFRATASELAALHGFEIGTGRDGRDAIDPSEFERWVREEADVVTEHLARVLRPRPELTESLRLAAEDRELALVSSSASRRVAACLEATGLDGLFPPAVRFSAEDSLATPASKPDPAIYLHALERLGVSAEDAVAVEDAAAGVSSAVGAGIPTIGNLEFVPDPEREDRAADLRAAGADLVASSWREVLSALGSGRVRENG